MNVNEVIEKAAALCRKYSAKEILLFGSRAKGTETERSDIDIAVSGILNSLKKKSRHYRHFTP